MTHQKRHYRKSKKGKRFVAGTNKNKTYDVYNLFNVYDISAPEYEGTIVAKNRHEALELAGIDDDDFYKIELSGTLIEAFEGQIYTASSLEGDDAYENFKNELSALRKTKKGFIVNETFG